MKSLNLLYVGNIWKDRFDQKGFREIFERRLQVGGLMKEVHILSPPGPQTRKYDNEAGGPDIWYHALEDTGNWNFFWLLVSVVKQGMKLIDQKKIDLIWSSEPTLTLLIGALCASLKKKPFVVTYHCDPQTVHEIEGRQYLGKSHWIDKKIEQWVLKKALASFYFSESQKKYFKKIISKEKCHLMRNTPRLDLFLPVQPDFGGAFLYLGRLLEQKGSRCLAEAYLQYRQKGGQRPLIIVGEGPLKKSCQEILKNIPEVTFKDFLPQKELPDIFRKSFCLVYPSKGEGFSNTLMEAQAAGLAVITNDVPSIHQGLLSQDVIFCKPLDIESFTQAMCLLDRDNALVKKMSSAAKSQVQNWWQQNPHEENKKTFLKVLNDSNISRGSPS